MSSVEQNAYVGDDAPNLQRVIRELSKHEKSILLLEKRLCEQEERHKKTENQLKNEIKCLKKEICQLRYVVLVMLWCPFFQGYKATCF